MAKTFLALILVASCIGCQSEESYRYWHEGTTFYRINVKSGVIDFAEPDTDGWQNWTKKNATGSTSPAPATKADSPPTGTKDDQIDR